MIKHIYKKLISEKYRIKIINTIQRFISPIYYGKNFYCNCCNKHFKKFLVKGNTPRPNAQCPFCSSLERTRVLDLYMSKELKLYEKENVKILHFAPEYGLLKKLNNMKNTEYIDADINPAYAKNIIDVTNIPFAENYFDYIICSHVLGHVPDEKKAISELFRVLKPSGTSLIMTLLSNKNKTFEDKNIKTDKDKLKFYGENNLCRLHGNDFAERLQNTGFIVEKIDYRTQLPNEVQNKHRLGDGKREIIFKCNKK